MRTSTLRNAVLVSVCLMGALHAQTLSFTLSMDQPGRHYYHVALRCDGVHGDAQDLKMPVWQPGYYRIMDFARNVINFRAESASGAPLPWDKTAKNTWRVKTAGAPAFVVSYDVYAFGNRNPAESYLDDTRGFAVPVGLFMHLAGQIQRPATITIRAPWSHIATGLDPVPGRANEFSAPNFDVLYDCPILMGNQEVRSFDVQGVPHYLVFEDVASGINREKMTADLKRMVESAVSVIGEIPYRHYTFLLMGMGGGGIEHANSSADMFDGSSLGTPAGYKRWLSYLAHEFFHLYNVKRIRPIALGPFDYDKENYTHMLWVSEGISVYYQDLIVERAGLFTRDEYFDRMTANIARYENSSGHLFQSATAASFDTWSDFFARDENMANTTISYYDKGAALGLLLDMSIRNATGNRKSLDDVMRALYQTYYKQKQRGFTDEEFRETCESIAGVPLPEIFEYASTVKPIDYPKYLSYAGLSIDVTPKAADGAYLGAVTQTRDNAVVIQRVEWDSPAQRDGLSAQDELISVDGIRITPRNLNAILAAKKDGDKVKVLVSRHNTIREFDVTLGKKTERSFRISVSSSATPAESEVLRSWLRQ